MLSWLWNLGPQVVGVGLVLGKNFEVISVTKGEGCWGIVIEKDILTHIDGKCLKGLKFEDVGVITRGPINSTAVLVLRRGDKDMEVKITRLAPVSRPASCFQELIERQIEVGKKRIDRRVVKDAFDRHRTAGGIPKQTFREALAEFTDTGLQEATSNEIDSFFSQLDRDDNGELDFEEFLQAVQNPHPLDVWVRSLNLQNIFSDAIPRKEGEAPLTTASKLSEKDIDIIFTFALPKVKEIFKSAVQRLKSSLDKAGQQSTDLGLKFQLQTPKMNCGKIENFHEGVTSRIGGPYLEYELAMKMEHERQKPFNENNLFETPNLKLKTYPHREWLILLSKGNLSHEDMRSDRVIPDISDLANDPSKARTLRREEIIALVLYTGPMFFIYNTILRQFPNDVFSELKSAESLFSTTIFVLASAVQKLCRQTRLKPETRLYRGVDGTVDLPEMFFKIDKNGCSGFLDWAFMSTTTELEVALSYARNGNSSGRVLVIEPGSVDRGASVSSFSQYPKENEYIFVPFSFVERSGPEMLEVTEQHGVIALIPVRVNSNLKTQTTDEYEELKKRLHVDTFCFQINQIERELKNLACRGTQVISESAIDDISSNGESFAFAIERLRKDGSWDKRDKRSPQVYIQEFLARILQQCVDVLQRHKATSYKEYLNNKSYRRFVLEMIEVKEMALTKLKEWLMSGSYIRFRWNAELRIVNRHWIWYLRQKLIQAQKLPVNDDDLIKARPQREAALELCKSLGFVNEYVEEGNDLNETRFLTAAAEGRSKMFLELLLEAGANLNEKRNSDGVTAIWLAAQNGHEECIRSLAMLGADLNAASHSGATPLFIAARNGKTLCAEALLELNAMISIGSKRSQPIHQAALNGHLDTLKLLLVKKAAIDDKDHRGLTPLDIAIKSESIECVEFLRAKKGTSHEQQEKRKMKKLIVSTGDISDVDGFMALAQYARTGADVLFIMNYPAYVGVEEADASFAHDNPGLGYKYSAKEFFEEQKSKKSTASYSAFMEQYIDQSDNMKMQRALTDLAFEMAKGVWVECLMDGELCCERGQFMFGIGGINEINPFSQSSIRNEVLVYAEIVFAPDESDIKVVATRECPLKRISLEPEQGVVYDIEGQKCDVFWTDYEDIYMDYNGSMAFWSGHLASQLSEKNVADRIRGVFIMGGVLANEMPKTLPPIDNVLNRFSSATMNQLYHPQNAANYLAFLSQFSIPTWVVSNNVVNPLDTMDDVYEYLQRHGIYGDYLFKLAKLHYSSIGQSLKKPYDHYCATALTKYLSNRAFICSERFDRADVFELDETIAQPSPKNISPAYHFGDFDFCQKTLFCSNVYGMTFISEHKSWETTRDEFIKAVVKQLSIADDGSEKQKNVSLSFKKELEHLMKVDLSRSWLEIYNLSIVDDKSTTSMVVSQHTSMWPTTGLTETLTDLTVPYSESQNPAS